MDKNKPVILKLRNKFTLDIFYSVSTWSSKEIDGVPFITVVKNVPSHNTQQTHFMRKDSLEVLK